MADRPKNALLLIGIPVLMCGVGVIAGYFGPIFLCRDCTDAPLNGLFISGPAGLLVGIGIAVLSVRLRLRTLSAIVATGAVLIALLGIALGLPEPRVVGEVVRANVVGCSRPAELVPAAVARWRALLAGNSSMDRFEIDQVPKMVSQSHGVVLSINVRARKEFFRHREPWRYGAVTAGAWKPEAKTEQVFARYAGGDCAQYSLNSNVIFAREWQSSNVTPPANLSAFLGLYSVYPVTSEWSPTAPLSSSEAAEPLDARRSQRH